MKIDKTTLTLAVEATRRMPYHNISVDGWQTREKLTCRDFCGKDYEHYDLDLFGNQAVSIRKEKGLVQMARGGHGKYPNKDSREVLRVEIGKLTEAINRILAGGLNPHPIITTEVMDAVLGKLNQELEARKHALDYLPR